MMGEQHTVHIALQGIIALLLAMYSNTAANKT